MKKLPFTILIGCFSAFSLQATLLDFNRENTLIWTDTEDQFDPPIANTAQYINMGSSGTDLINNVAVDGDVDFTLSTSAPGNVFNRYRNSATYGPKNRFFMDFVGASSGQSYTLTFTNLAEGTYDFRSWHYDPAATQFTASSTQTRTAFLTDAIATSANKGTVTSYGNDNPDLNNPSDPDPFFTVVPFYTQLVSNGTDAVSLTYSGGSGGVFVINGLEITSVPEPTTYAALLGLAMLSLAAWRRHRA